MCAVTLQPIDRFPLDAAIIFADILLPLEPMGLHLEFAEGEGPVIHNPVRDRAAVERLKVVDGSELDYVAEAIRQTRRALDGRVPLIGFAGAPWTLAAYMLEGRGSPDQRAAKLAAYRDPVKFKVLLDLLSEAVAWHLLRQFEAGADVVQIFDSWAGGLPDHAFAEWVIAPNKRVVEIVRQHKPGAKIIGFPRAASQSGYERYVTETGVNAVSIDTATPFGWAMSALGGKAVPQGNLDPIALIAGGAALDRAVDRILDVGRGKPFIFNLGHGVLPETPLEHVAQTIARIRSRG